jgi:hypothetical protein
MNIQENRAVYFLLRFGVAFTFLFAACSAFYNPEPWIHYFPAFVRDAFSVSTLVATWGGAEIGIGLWLLSGYKIFIPSVAAVVLLSGVFFFDYHAMSIIFRNVSIIATSLSLAIISNPWRKYS